MVSELRLAAGRDDTGVRHLAVGVALISAGACFSLLDVTRTWCLPDHPFLQGHAIWHGLSALALLACYFHYRQFEDELGPAPA